MFFIGEILKTKGNKGGLIVGVSPDFYFNNKEEIISLHLKSKKRSIDLSIERIGMLGNDLLIKFTNINTISEAYGYIGYSVYIEDDKASVFQRDSYINYNIFDIDGNYWGKVINDEISEFTHTLEIRDENDIIFIPFSDGIVTKTDNKKKIIIIDPPSGLRDLNR